MTRSEIEAEITKLTAANEAATGWGAAVGARSERIVELQRELRRMDREAAKMTDTLPQQEGNRE